MHGMIRDCWKIILQTEEKLLNHQLCPLAGLDPCIDRFDLPPMAPLAGTWGDAPALPAATPGFKVLTDEVLLSLRHHLGDRSEIATVEPWAEKLLRFCELRRRSLESRARAKCDNPAAARLHVLHLAAFLMDYALYSRDLRFLNTVLKIADLSWVLSRKTIERNLASKGGGFVSALFQFRIVLMSEYAVDRLRRDGTL